MKFTITFVSYFESHSVPNLKAGGFELADIALSAGIPITKIPQVLNANPGPYAVVELDVATARRSGLFLESGSATVKVKPTFGKKDYVYIHAEWDPETEEAIVEWRIDKESIRQDWIEAGCPAEWDRTQPD